MKQMTNYEQGLYQAHEWMINNAGAEILCCSGEDAERRATEYLNVASAFLYDYWHNNGEIYFEECLRIETLRDELKAKIARRENGQNQ